MTAIEDVRQRYMEFFEEVGGKIDLQRLIEKVDSTVDFCVDKTNNILAKLMSIREVEEAIDEVIEYYSICLPANILNNLRADLNWLLERAKTVVVKNG